MSTDKVRPISSMCTTLRVVSGVNSECYVICLRYEFGSDHSLGKPLQPWVELIHVLGKPLGSRVELTQNLSKLSWFDSDEVIPKSAYGIIYPLVPFWQEMRMNPRSISAFRREIWDLGSTLYLVIVKNTSGISSQIFSFVLWGPKTWLW